MKSSKEKRFKERNAWHELKIIIKSYRALGFDYIIKRAPLTNVCFGTTLGRDVLPTPSNTSGKQSMSPLMVRILPKPIISTIRQSPSNISKSTICNTINERKHKEQMYSNFGRGQPPTTSTSPTVGYGPLASKSTRFQSHIYDYGPSIYRYADANLKLFNNTKGRIPHLFKRTKRRLTTLNGYCTITPGPDTYVFHKRKSNIFMHSFGGKRHIRPVVQTICMVKPLHKCSQCNVQPPIGDYWQNKKRQILCRLCMMIERESALYRSRTKHLKIKRLQELGEFERFRDCSYYHQHQNTTAAVRLMNKNELQRKIYRENYLNMFNM